MTLYDSSGMIAASKPCGEPVAETASDQPQIDHGTFESIPFFFSTLPFRLLYSSLIMTVIETIMRDIQSLSLRQQVEVARYVQRLSETARRKRVAVLSQTYGSLDETDGRAFEEALTESRKVDTHG